MITGKHVREELKEGAKKFEEATTVEDRLAVIFKLVTVVIKVALSTRDNTTSIMNKTGAERRPSRRRDENADTAVEPKIAIKE